MVQSTRPMLAAPRSAQTLEAGWNPSSGQWDADAWRVMNGRDDALISDEVVNGVISEKFIYQFQVAGTDVVGISVIGARYLAYHYGGLKHRVVATIQKSAELFTFTTYPHDGTPMTVSCSVIRELADQPDFFQTVVEVNDTQTGNSIQIEKREYRYERKRDGTEFERPHYSIICQSKALRNAYLSLIPADVQIKWRNRMVAEKKMVDITGSVIEEKRSGVLRYAARQALAIDRHAVEALTLDQITGLGEAARSEQTGAFVNAARALGLEISLGSGEDIAEQQQPTGQQQRSATATASTEQTQTPAQQSGPAPQQQQSGDQPRRRGRPPGPGKAAALTAREGSQSGSSEAGASGEGAGAQEGDEGDNNAAPQAEQGNAAPAQPTPTPTPTATRRTTLQFE